MKEWYREDLAHIHDAGFRDYALESAPGILEVLAGSGIREGLVVDLGCGGGLWARELLDAGYRVLGIDISGAMIELARKSAPEAEFRVGSLFEADVPPCAAVTAVGEALNYLFDPANERGSLGYLFRRVHDALSPGGIFVFDVAELGQVPPGERLRGFTEGEDRVVLVEKEEHAGPAVLTRRIAAFRRASTTGATTSYTARGCTGRRSPRTSAPPGVRVETTRSCGSYRLPENHVAFVARKPA